MVISKIEQLGTVPNWEKRRRKLKRALFKDTLREIKNTYKVFISILLMAFLGVGFFAGIRATSPDMVKTIDTYYKENNVYDIEILSTLGLTDDDINELNQIDGINQVYGEYSKDVIIDINEIELVTKLISISDINKLILKEGRMPENSNECLVEKGFTKHVNIGETIRIDEKDDNEIIKNKELKIVGIIESPLYISRQRGNSKLGTGSVDYCMYIPKENVDSEIYTQIYATVDEKYITSTTKYENYIEEIKNRIEEIKGKQEKQRYDSILQEANTKIDDAQAKLDEEKTNAENKIKDAENEISNNESKINIAQNTINSNKKNADAKFKDAQNQISKCKTDIINNEKEIDKQEAQLQYIQDPNQLAMAKKQIEQAKVAIASAKQELQQKEQELDKTKESTFAQIKSSQKEINNSKDKIVSAKRELEDKKQEFNIKIADAQKELDDAKQDISKIEMPKWYVLDRKSNNGYNSFTQDTKSIENIGKVFPIIFFIVATLISLTSMTRMVEEHRVQIGTLKALGYNKIQIASKYIIYSSVACIIGGILGQCVGFVLLPKIIWMMYSMMYTLATDIVLEFNVYYGGLGLLITSICIIGATIYTTLKSLKHTPAKLMRPKAPKIGKRVLLERITFIWKRLKFSNKVTVRNIFRYKKRFLMTIIGICGCTALILVGFGVKDSISSILERQYSTVYNYDMQISLKSDLSVEQKNEAISKLIDNENILNITQAYSTSGTLSNKGKEDIQIIVSNNNDLENVINMRDAKTKQKINMEEDKIYITDKLAQLIDTKVGDKVIIEDSENVEKQVTVGGIVENYISHYVYMSENLYRALYGEISTNTLYIQTIDLTEEQEVEFSKNIMQNDMVSTIMINSDVISLMDDMLKSLNYVVVVLIVSAGLLAFVVLYNLANVNINERIRELATIKVLGFYDKEVYSYITKETVILTIIGIILGLFAGYFLNSFIIKTCEINMLRFSSEILPQSYIYSAAITLIFTAIVNFVTYFALKKIDMIESLKSVE